MLEPTNDSLTMSDGYPTHLTQWKSATKPTANLIVVHGVQSHGGWYHNLGRVLSARGFNVTIPDRRGSGKNDRERGHVSNYHRLVADIAELARSLKAADPHTPIGLAGISWGGKLVVITAAKHPELVDALALICPGLHPQVDVTRKERLRIALAFFTNKRKHFPIPLADPALFTASPSGQAFIANDPLSLRTASASLLAASRFIDRAVSKSKSSLRQPSLLMLGAHDRIVDNARTLAYFQEIPAQIRDVITYPEGHHTLEFESDPSRYANDLADWFTRALPQRS
jgi:alpha-beta hydrolase superfamily lysophospholipase